MTTSDADPPRLRRDTARTRDRLIAVAGELLAERGPTFSLPDLARAGAVSTATVYRHFTDVHDVYAEFLRRLATELVDELRAIPPDVRGRSRFERMCERWAELAAGWGRAATHIRSPAGFLERVHAGDPLTSSLYGALAPAVAQLIEDGELPETELDYAVLVWITLFDERVIVDLTVDLGWTPRAAGRRLADAVRGALGAAPRRDGC